jgi:2'-5' RNA ligase
MRTFLAIEIPAGIRKEIHAFVQTVKDDRPIKWVGFDNLHITLKFLGEIDEAKKVLVESAGEEVASGFTPFEIALAGVGCFPGVRNPRVLWIGVTTGAEQVSNLARRIEDRFADLGFKEEKKFHPHLTIGRIKDFCPVSDLTEKVISTERFPVASLTLFKSTLKPEGPTYQGLSRIKLGPNQQD